MMLIKKLILAAACLCLLVTSACKKKSTDNNSNNNTTVSCKLLGFTDTVYSGTNKTITVNEYSYDANGNITSIVEKEGGNTTKITTVIWNASKISHVIEKNGMGDTNLMSFYTYTGNNITQIVETSKSSSNDTFTFGYNSSNQITSFKSDDISFSNISWNGNNISKLTLTALGIDLGTATFTYDNKPNFHKKYILTSDPGEFLSQLGANNLLLATADADIVPLNVKAGDKLFNFQYTYNSKNEVSLVTEGPTAFDSEIIKKSVNLECK